MRWGTLYVNESLPSILTSDGHITLPSLNSGNIIHFTVTGNIRVISGTSSGRRLLDVSDTITNTNANSQSVPIAVRFGTAFTLSSDYAQASFMTMDVFTYNLTVCDSITATVNYDTITPVATSTSIACMLPFGVDKSFSFSLW
jgi:hypothetical protein